MKKDYELWVAENVPDPHMACAETTLSMVAAFPELRRVRGHIYTSTGHSRPHWWCVGANGTIVDPTVVQFVGHCVYDQWDESQEEPTSKCLYCGDLCYDRKEHCSITCLEANTKYLDSIGTEYGPIPPAYHIETPLEHLETYEPKEGLSNREDLKQTALIFFTQLSDHYKIHRTWTKGRISITDCRLIFGGTLEQLLEDGVLEKVEYGRLQEYEKL